jgi:hypothetical protein
MRPLAPARSLGPTRIRACATALALCLLLTPGTPAEAQLIQLDPAGPQEQDPVVAPPDDIPVAAPSAPMPVAPEDRGRTVLSETAVPSSGSDPLADPVDGVLLPLRLVAPRADTPRAPRLSGEVVRARFTLFLPAATGPAQIRIAHRSGIDVLPDLSQLEVAVNGTPVGQFQPGNFDGFGLTQLDVPGDLLRAGSNIVEITARHSHRIACGPEAAFALWTDIDSDASGVMVPSSALGPGPMSFLAALSAQTARGQPVTIRRPDPLAPLDEAAPFIAQVVAALGGAPPEILSVSYWAPSDGVPDLVRITALEPGTGPDTPSFEQGGDGAIVLLVERGRGYDGVSSGLRTAAGSAGLMQPVPVLAPGTPMRLDALSAPFLQAEGRYALVPVEFRLPPEWLLLASQRARLDLDYRIAPGLPEGAVMLVKVNGTTVRLLPLDRDGGVALPTLPVRFQAALLRPGVNRLEFEVLVPGDPPDTACPPMAGPIVEILPGSRLFVPEAPAMTMPSLDRALDALPAEGVRLTEAAARVLPPGALPQIASALGLGTRDPVGTATLTIGTPADIERIRAPLVAEAAGPLADALRRAPTGAGAAGPMPAAPTPAAGSGAAETAGGAQRTGVRAWLDDATERLHSAPRRLVRGETPDLADWLEGRRAQAALLQPDPAEEHSLWLIIAQGADPADIARALALSRTAADGPTGQVALYAPDTGWQSWTAPDRPLRLLEAPRAGTLRAVMGNYATHRPTTFVGLLMALTVLSALVAILILLTTRRGRS